MRGPGVRADLKGEHRRLDRGGRHRADRGQRVPARADHGGALARRSRARGSRGRALRAGDRRRRQPVRPVGRARRRGDRRDARTDGGDLHRKLRPEADLDPAAAALARFRGRQRARAPHGPRDLLGVRCRPALPPRPDRGAAACAGVACRLRAHRGAAAGDRHAGRRADRPVRGDRGACGGCRPSGPDDRRCSRRPRGAPVGRAHHRLRVRARHRGLRLDRAARSRGHQRARRRRHRRPPGRPAGREELRGTRRLVRRAQRRGDPPRPWAPGQAARARRSDARRTGRAARVPRERPVPRDTGAHGPEGDDRLA